MSIDSPNEKIPSNILTSDDYIHSLRGRKLKIYLMGERVDDPVDHPMMRPSVNAMSKTYDLALEDPELATVSSPYTGEKVNRFLHIAASAEEVVLQNKMQRRLGQLTGTCFQRCVGMDALNALFSVTYEIDARHGTPYHARLKALQALTSVKDVFPITNDNEIRYLVERLGIDFLVKGADTAYDKKYAYVAGSEFVKAVLFIAHDHNSIHSSDRDVPGVIK